MAEIRRLTFIIPIFQAPLRRFGYAQTLRNSRIALDYTHCPRHENSRCKDSTAEQCHAFLLCLPMIGNLALRFLYNGLGS